MMLDLYGHMERNRQYFMNSNLCRICGYRNNNTEFIAREMNFGMKDEFTYFICNKCGCIQIAAKPDDLSAYYDTNRYYSFQRSDESDKNKLIKYSVGMEYQNECTSVDMTVEQTKYRTGDLKPETAFWFIITLKNFG